MLVFVEKLGKRVKTVYPKRNGKYERIRNTNFVSFDHFFINENSRVVADSSPSWKLKVTNSEKTRQKHVITPLLTPYQTRCVWRWASFFLSFFLMISNTRLAIPGFKTDKLVQKNVQCNKKCTETCQKYPKTTWKMYIKGYTYPLPRYSIKSV